MGPAMDFVHAENYAFDLTVAAALAVGALLFFGTAARWPFYLAALLFGVGIGAYAGIDATATGRFSDLPLWMLQKQLVESWEFAPEKVMRPEDFKDCADRRDGGMAAIYGTVTMCPEDFKKPKR